jgi:hypothetical protein
MCGDVNINYLSDKNRGSQLGDVLHYYNLTGTVKFPSRFGLNSQSAIDHVSIDTSAFGKCDLYPHINGLSDNDAQLLILNTGQKPKKERHNYFKRINNKHTIADFKMKLSYETRELVFNGYDVNEIFQLYSKYFFKNLLF